MHFALVRRFADVGDVGQQLVHARLVELPATAHIVALARVPFIGLAQAG